MFALAGPTKETETSKWLQCTGWTISLELRVGGVSLWQGEQDFLWDFRREELLTSSPPMLAKVSSVCLSLCFTAYPLCVSLPFLVCSTAFPCVYHCLSSCVPLPFLLCFTVFP